MIQTPYQIPVDPVQPSVIMYQLGKTCSGAEGVSRGVIHLPIDKGQGHAATIHYTVMPIITRLSALLVHNTSVHSITQQH